MTSKLSLEDVLALKYINAWEWAPAGDRIALVWDDGGRYELWIAYGDGSEPPHRLAEPEREITDFAWHPDDNSLVYVKDGELWRAVPEDDWYRLDQLTAGDTKVQAPSWDPSGHRLAFVRDEKAWLRDMDSGFERALSFPGRVVAARHGSQPALDWSPDGTKLACSFVDDEDRRQLGVCQATGELIWYTRVEAARAGGASWLTDQALLYAVSRELETIRDYYIARFSPNGAEASVLKEWKESGVRFSPPAPVPSEHIYRQQDQPVRGSLMVGGTYPSPDGSSVMFVLENDGWAHLYLYDVATKDLRQMTFGECEDYGQAGDEPQWSPDGTRVVFASNRSDSAQRELWLLDPETGEQQRLTTFEGTNLNPKWSPDGSRVAFVHCDPWRNQDLWSIEVGAPSTDPVQLTNSMTDSWTSATVSWPEEVVFAGGKDWDIHGFVFKPVDFDPDKQYPALVWVHGGPIRQMRYGFHAMHSYALFYAYHQYLAHRSYVSISVNYRGGIGYGREFRNGLYHAMGVDDVADVVAAGRYLKSLPYVDSSRVAVWGLSYGGYMTLHALTQYPEEFCAGINIAGIWDFAQWTDWVEKRWGRHGGLFKVFLGGDPDESPELYRQASPVTFRKNIKRPLINFQGTKDANVDFEQLDRIVKDCIELGYEYEAYYYPDEVHTFRWRKTWRDAFSKLERELDSHLKHVD